MNNIMYITILFSFIFLYLSYFFIFIIQHLFNWRLNPFIFTYFFSVEYFTNLENDFGYLKSFYL
jgi:hypothetical protein